MHKGWCESINNYFEEEEDHAHLQEGEEKTGVV
jgi:hypothetical protein